MGQDTTALTVIGVKICIDKFGDVSTLSCDCDSDESFLCCPNCGSKMEMRDDLENEVNFDLRDGEFYDSKLGKYQLYREYYANKLVNKTHFYICIYKGEKFDLNEDVKFGQILEQLVSERDQLKEYLMRLNLLTSEEFSESFGIFTLISMNY